MSTYEKYQLWVSVISTICLIITAIIYYRQLKSMQKQVKETAIMTHHTTRFNLWSNLFDSFDHINECAKATPIENSPYPNSKSGDASSLLFHHLNLIFKYWTFKELFSKDEWAGFERWLEVVFFQWVQNNHDTFGYDLIEIIRFEDLYPSEFLEWFSNNEGFKKIKDQLKSQA